MADNLRGRVADRATKPGTDVAVRSEKAVLSLHGQMERYNREYTAALPTGFAVEQFMQDALNCIRRTRNLVLCDPPTVLGGFMTFAQMGLRPGVLGQGWLLPFKNRKASEKSGTDVYEAQLVVGYKGFKELAYRSPAVAFVQAFVRCERDEWLRKLGTDPGIHHIPYDGLDPNPPVGYYAIVKYANGHVQYEYMSRTAVLEHRDRFAMQKYWHEEKRRYVITGPWVDHEEAMCLKTPFRRLCDRYVPLSPQHWEVPVLHRALEADGSVRRDLSPDSDLLSLEHPRPEDAGPMDGELLDERPAVPPQADA